MTLDSMTGKAVIETHDLTKTFGDEVVVDRVNLTIPEGIIFGFIGPSGSGKTTIVRMLLGTSVPDAGEVCVLGQSLATMPQSVRARIGYMPQQFVLYPELTVRENLSFAASLYGVGFQRKALFAQLLELVELDGHESKTVGQLSGGMQRRLSLAASIVHDPTLIFLDEPTAGIDPILRRKFWDYFGRLKEDDRSLFVTTQYVTEAAYCDLVGLLVDGRLLVVDTPDGLRRRALGGDIIHFHSRDILTLGQLQALRELPFVNDGKVSHLPDRGLALVVDDASVALPKLVQWCQTENIEVESASEFIPPFDDVFVDLITQAEEAARIGLPEESHA